MVIIGICGNSGSGKSTVCGILEKLGARVLDCDVIYHKLVNSPSECLTAIGNRFGPNLIENGQLNRHALRNIVFNDKEKLQELNKISHHYVKLELKKEITLLQENSEKICVIDAPMFFEASLDSWCDLVCAVVSDFDTQVSRICSRDGISHSDAKNRLSKQIPADELINRSDFVIKNTGDLKHLETECNNLISIACQKQTTEREDRPNEQNEQ